VEIRLALAQAAIAWERLWNGLWTTIVLLMAGLALAFTDVLPSLPALVHLIVLIAFAAAVAFLAVRGLRGFRRPTRLEARARLEAHSPVVHRPLTTAEDTLAPGSSPLQRALWQRHQQTARALLGRLRNPWPAGIIAGRDVFAVRAVVALLLFVSAVGAGRDMGNRLERALLPSLIADRGPVTAKLWITPPAYTNRSPVFLEVPTSGNGATPHQLEVPADSKALIVVTGARNAALVQKRDGRVTQSTPLAALSDPGADAADTASSSRAETKLGPMDRLEIRRGGRVLAAWPVAWIADRPPTVAIVQAPRDAGSGRLRIDYTVDDDYGVRGLVLHITRAQDGHRRDGNAAVDVPLLPPPHDTKVKTFSTLVDLAANPWTGLPVQLQLAVTDQAGQSTTSAVVTAVLPERTFTHPVAQELARQRKALIANPAEAAGPARESFARLLENPDSYDGDHVVYLALSAAMYRLSYNEPDEAMKGLPDLLWYTAVRVEDGDRAAAESRMAAAERELQNALSRDASSEDISRLVDQLQRALADYMQALYESMPGQDMEMGSIDSEGNVVSPDDIAGMMEQMRQLAQIGSRDAAREMMAQIQNMLQALRNAASADGNSPEVKAAEDLMREMRALSETQSQLLNDSFNQVRREALHGKNENAAQGNKAAARQQALRRQLDTVQQRLSEMTGQPSGNLRDADKAMRDAEAALKANAWQAGAETQGVALAKLEAGLRQATQQLLKSLADKGVSGFVQMPAGRRFGQGNSRQGLTGPEQVEVPDRPDAEGMAQRVRVILEELRKRASDRNRPAEEQEYLRRLMKEF
jgi:uncharacterized protein (TIGR02302 family)